MKPAITIPLCVVISVIQLCLGAYFILLIAIQPSLAMGLVYFTTIVVALIAAGIYQLMLPPTAPNVMRQVLYGNQPNKLPIFAHRGAGLDAPENTLAAIREAKKNGADGVEFDVAFTRDNIAVLFHDEEIDRTTDGSGRLDELTFDQIRSLDASANHLYHDRFKGEKIPTFEEALEECLSLNVRMIIDLKDYDFKAVAMVLEMFKKYPELYKTTLVASFYPTVIYQLRQSDLNIATALTWRPRFFSYHEIIGGRPKYSSPWKMAMAIITDNIYEWALHGWLWHITGVSTILIHKDVLSHEYIRKWRKNKMNIVAWTVNHQIEKDFINKELQIPIITDTLR